MVAIRRVAIKSLDGSGENRREMDARMSTLVTRDHECWGFSLIARGDADIEVVLTEKYQ